MKDKKERLPSEAQAQSMKRICPACNQLMDVVSLDRSGNLTAIGYSCGHKQSQVLLEDTIRLEDSLRLKIRDQKGRLVVKSKTEGRTEKRMSMRQERAIQLVFEEGRIVHLHCKSEDCGNEWKTGKGTDLNMRFDMEQTRQGVWTIRCRKCGRSYSSG